MTIDATPDITALLRAAARRPMLPAGERRDGPTLDRRAVEALLPHRDPFLFIDGVAHVNREAGTIVCWYDLTRAAAVTAGHFPDWPVWPGVLQAEAIGQAGMCLVRLLDGRDAGRKDAAFALTQILGAEFVRPVAPAGQLEIVTRRMRDGLFTIFVGQCLQEGIVCSAAAVRGISQESEHEP